MKINILAATFTLVVGIASSALAAPPTNDNYANATVITGLSGTAAGTNVEATTESGETYSGSHSIWYRWTAPANGTAAFDTLGSEFDTRLHAFTGTTLGALSTVASNDDASDSDYGESRVSFSVTSGTTYSLRVSSYDTGDMHPTVLNWLLNTPPANDNFADAAALSGASGTITESNLRATNEEDEDRFDGDHSVWFLWTAPFTGTVQFDTLGSAEDTTLVFGTGSSISSLAVLSANDDSSAPGAGTTSRVRVPVTSGIAYRIRLATLSGGGNLTLNWAQTNYLPSVISFSNATYAITEAGPVATITFSRTIGSDNDAVSALVFTEDGSAIGGDDYEDTNRSITFAQGVTTASTTIPIYEDVSFEGEETVNLRLTDPSETAALGLSRAVLTIQDDDPMIPLKAAYRGLVTLPIFDQALTGLMNINADGKGNLTGSLLLAGVKYGFKATFAATGKASVSITRKNGQSNLTLNLAYADDGDAIRGTLGDGSKIASLELGRVIYGPGSIYPSAPTFTILIPGNRAAATNEPKGDSFLSASVDKAGKVKVIGSLADGSPISAGGSLVGEELFPLYIPLYKGKGSFSSTLDLSSGGDSDARFYKPALSSEAAFKDGFNLAKTAIVMSITPRPVGD